MAKIFQSGGMVVFEDNEPYLGSEPQGTLSIDLQGNTLRVYSSGKKTYITPYLKAEQILDENGAIYGDDIKEVRDALNLFFLVPSTSQEDTDLEKVVGKSFDNASQSTASTAFVNLLPSSTLTLDSEFKYKLEFDLSYTNSGGFFGTRIEARIRIGTTILDLKAGNFDFIIGVPLGISCFSQIDGTGNEETVFFEFRSSDGGLVTVDRASYKITRIGK